MVTLTNNDENVLVVGNVSGTNILVILFVIILAIGIIGLASAYYDFTATPSYFYYETSLIEYAFIWRPAWGALITCGILGAIMSYFWLSKCSITITDKRAYGTAAFGKRVDLPVDMISAVSVNAFKGISITTASGRLTFYLIQNRDAIFDVVSNLLLERQKSTHISSSIATEKGITSNADELKKYKELLDMGIITQEEFDAKKKQLLGL